MIKPVLKELVLFSISPYCTKSVKYGDAQESAFTIWVHVQYKKGALKNITVVIEKVSCHV